MEDGTAAALGEALTAACTRLLGAAAAHTHFHGAPVPRELLAGALAVPDDDAPPAAQPPAHVAAYAAALKAQRGRARHDAAFASAVARAVATLRIVGSCREMRSASASEPFAAA